MSTRAWTYIISVLLFGLVLTTLVLTGIRQVTTQWLTIVVFTLLATATQLIKARAPGHQSYHPTLALLFASLLLLNPALFVLVVVICHLIEWIKERLIDSPRLRAWYLQPFNMASHLIAGFAARWVYTQLDVATSGLIAPATLLAVTTAALVYVISNHLIVGLALVLARKVSWHESGVLQIENLVTDLILLWLGSVVAVLWRMNYWLILPALSPLVLMHRALMIPQLKKEAQTDDKTGLLNARHFIDLYTRELERSNRFGRPLAFIMADLDLLRNINNTYGHLAGDQVLVGIGRIIRETIREYDIAGRFGGEEFSIVLPEVSLAEARAFAERLRQAIEEADFEVKTSPTPLHATMSLGVACYPQDAISPTDLIHEADVAVYRAKLSGRNRVVCASEVPHSFKLETASLGEERLAQPYTSVFVPRIMPSGGEVEAGPDVPVQPVGDKVKTTTERGSIPSGQSVTSSVSGPKAWLWTFIGSVIAAGIGLTVMSLQMWPTPDIVVMGMLAALAVVAQLLQLKNIYRESSVSVSIGINFAAALIAGLPGVALVSGVITLAHYIQRRPVLYKTAFNYAVHLLAGSAPVFFVTSLGISTHAPNMPLLLIPTLASALAYYIVETGLIATGIGLSEGLNIQTAWQQRYRWLAEHYVVLGIFGLLLAVAYAELGPLGILIFTLPVFMMHYSQKQYIDRTEKTVQELRRMNDELTQANREIVGASQAIQQLNSELFLTIGKIADARDPYLAGHAAQVALYATAIATEMDLPVERLEHLRQAALLHDIGKIGIPEHILYKPDGLTDEEYEQFRAHSTLGGEFLATCQGLRHLVPFVRHHHEWWDGHGYPDGLQREEIPLEARILAVCDAVEAMASDRAYHQAMPLTDILDELANCNGTQFDPSVVEAFIRLAEGQGTHLIINSAQEVTQERHDPLVTLSIKPAWATV